MSGFFEISFERVSCIELIFYQELQYITINKQMEIKGFRALIGPSLTFDSPRHQRYVTHLETVRPLRQKVIISICGINILLTYLTLNLLVKSQQTEQRLAEKNIPKSIFFLIYQKGRLYITLHFNNFV